MIDPFLLSSTVGFLGIAAGFGCALLERRRANWWRGEATAAAKEAEAERETSRLFADSLNGAASRLASTKEALDYWCRKYTSAEDELAQIKAQRKAAGEKGRAVQAAKRRAATGTESESFAALRGEIAA